MGDACSARVSSCKEHLPREVLFLFLVVVGNAMLLE